MGNYIVVPEGVASDRFGNPLPQPSFVYRQVLDYVVNITEVGDAVYLAPANHYGGLLCEHEVGFEYLVNKLGKGVCLFCPPVRKEQYIDTYGNARDLKRFLPDAMQHIYFELVCAYIHSYRAAYCFKKEGFRFKKIHRVYYKITDEHIVPRLWYYRFKPVHYAYEIGAFIRDVMR